MAPLGVRFIVGSSFADTRAARWFEAHPVASGVGLTRFMGVCIWLVQISTGRGYCQLRRTKCQWYDISGLASSRRGGPSESSGCQGQTLRHSSTAGHADRFASLPLPVRKYQRYFTIG